MHTNWLRQAAIPVTTTVAGNGFADLQPLKNVIGDDPAELLEGMHYWPWNTQEVGLTRTYTAPR